MHHQGWDIELLEVFGEIRLGEGFDALISVQQAGLHAPEPELIQRALRLFYTLIGTIKRRCEILVELRAVLHDTAPHVVEHIHWEALRIRRGLEHDWRHCGDKDRFGNALRS